MQWRVYDYINRVGLDIQVSRLYRLLGVRFSRLQMALGIGCSNAPAWSPSPNETGELLTGPVQRPVSRGVTAYLVPSMVGA